MKTIKQNIFTLLLVGITFFATAQSNTEGVKISNDVTPPHPSAMFEVDADNKGVLFPRVEILDLNTAAPVSAPEESLLVYNTSAATGVGYYYWSNNKWNKLGSENGFVPKVTWAELVAMSINMTDDDWGMQVYVTTYEATWEPGIGGVNTDVFVRGLWYWGQSSCASPVGFEVQNWRKVQSYFPFIGACDADITGK